MRAQEDVPPFTRSSVDGFAIMVEDARAAGDAPIRLTIAGAIRMGEPATRGLRRGEAMRVPTGGALPDGASGVVKVEDCLESDGSIEFRGMTDAHEHVTQRGADVACGDLLAARGDVLTAGAVGMLAGAGVMEIPVFATPIVGLLVSGDEIAAPGQPLRAGEIRDINGIALEACLRAMGCAPKAYPLVADRREDLAAALRRALDECDAVVISGGSSVGERDYTPAVVAAAGAPGVIVHGVAARPGRPTMLGIVDEKPVIGLPGNPVSALVMLETLGKPVLLRLFDKTDDTPRVQARLREPIDGAREIERIVPVRLAAGAGTLEATPLTGTSAQMHILGFADALVRVPAGTGRLEAGTRIEALPLTRSNGLW